MPLSITSSISSLFIHEEKPVLLLMYTWYKIELHEVHFQLLFTCNYGKRVLGNKLLIVQ